MRKFNESILGSALSVCLGMVWVGSFLPFGAPALWLVIALMGAGLGSWLLPSRPLDAMASRAVAALVLAFLMYPLLHGASVLIHGGAARELDKPVRFAIAGLTVWWLARVPLRRPWLMAGLVTAAATALGYALYARLLLGQERAGLFVNPIQFGVMATVISLVSAMLAIGWPQAATGLAWRRWLWTAVALASAAAVFSGSLTAMLAMVVLPFMVFFGWGQARWRRMAIASTIIALPVLGAVTAAHGPWQDRFTSNESRLENFASAVDLFRESPWIGVGRDGFVQRRHQMMAEGRISAYTASFNVAHSEYFDAMAKRGVLGLTGVLLLFALPIGVFVRLVRVLAGEARAWAAAGLATTLAFALASLTQNVITHGSGSNMMAVTLVTCLVAALQSRPAAQGPHVVAQAVKS